MLYSSTTFGQSILDPCIFSKHPGNNKPLPYLRYGGSAGFAPVGVGRGFPTFGVRRPPSRTRRPVGVQFQAARKFRKGGGRTVGTCSSTAPVNNMKGTATSNGSGDGAGASSSSNGQTVSTAAKGGVPTSGNTK